MGLKATCPNDPNHKNFLTVAHVTQDWEVDEEGNFIAHVTGGEQVIHGPDPGNSWTCVECGAAAKVERT